MKRLTFENQKEFCYAISPFNKPRIIVDPDETFIVDTEDAMSGQIRKEGDKRDYRKAPFTNPLAGPIYVKGAEKGDVLVVEVKDIKQKIEQGVTLISKWWWYLGHKPSASIVSEFVESKMPSDYRILPVRNGKIQFGTFYLPYKPMIGTIGTAPEIESISSYLPSMYGGNMDLPCITKGCKLYLPVKVEGALLHVGDVHALQGEGEISGTAIEMPAEVTLKVGVIKNKEILWPRIEDSEYLMGVACTGTGRTLEDTIRIAFVNLVEWMEEYGVEKWDAWMMCCFLGKIILGNIWSVAAGFPKMYLPKL
ncbi:MAG: acetamidase/formamidase family protein [Nitrososphaeria archaeon]